MPLPRPRLSLLNAVLLVTIAALALGLIAANDRIARVALRNEVLAAENKKHRDRLGLFDVQDKSLIHAIRLPSGDHSGWYFRYRLYLPEGRTYVLRYGTSWIPQEGLPESSSKVTADLQPGEYVIATRFEPRYDRKSGEPIPRAKLTIRVEPEGDQHGSRSTSVIGLAESQQDWIVNKETKSMQFGASQIGRELEVHSHEEPIVLVRARPRRVLVRQRSADGLANSYSTEKIEGPTDGFMIWVEAVEKIGGLGGSPVVAE